MRRLDSLKQNREPEQTTLSPEQFAARLEAEKEKLVRVYCDAFKFWRDCRYKRCRKLRRCGEDTHACLQRRLGEVPRMAQWHLRQRIIIATPERADEPERIARKLMPYELLEGA
jgi:hypothetical protein